MRNRGSAIASVLQSGEKDGAHDRVLRATFWLSSSSHGHGATRACAELTLLETARARREQTR
ncbi:MAG: hypothetical protein ACLQVI_30820 [Polyangiaceae bacterium]